MTEGSNAMTEGRGVASSFLLAMTEGSNDRRGHGRKFK
jgi:hypothetical protein